MLCLQRVVIVAEAQFEHAQVGQVRRLEQRRHDRHRLVGLFLLLSSSRSEPHRPRENLIEVERMVAHVVDHFQPADQAGLGAAGQHCDDGLGDGQHADGVEPAAGEPVVPGLVLAAPVADEEPAQRRPATAPRASSAARPRACCSRSRSSARAFRGLPGRAATG